MGDIVGGIANGKRPLFDDEEEGNIPAEETAGIIYNYCT